MLLGLEFMNIIEVRDGNTGSVVFTGAVFEKRNLKKHLNVIVLTYKWKIENWLTVDDLASLTRKER